MTIDVQHDPSARKFFTNIDGHEAYLLYREAGDGRVDFASTFVPPPLRGGGVAGRIVEEALSWARDRGLEVIPSCPYVDSYIDRHPEFHGLVAQR